ncbi:MAG: murein biosynthesis integral membrane protein MurJ [Acidobacteriota bacterium]
MKKSRISTAAGLVSLATLISRILGVVREQVLAAYFGAGFLTDAFIVAFRIPNLLRDLFAEGAMSASFVPTFTRYLKEAGRLEAMKLANIVINLLLVILSGFTLVIFVFARYFVYVLASGFTPEKMQLTIKLTRIMSPFLLFVAIAAIFMGILNTFNRFFIPAFAPAVFNICCILCGIFLSPVMPSIGQEPIVSMAVGAFLGGLGQLFIQVPQAIRIDYRYRFSWNFSHPGLARIVSLMAPATFGLAATQINILVDNQIASYFGDGPVSWLNYSFRIMMLPIGLFGVAIATANLSAVSKDAAEGDINALKITIAKSIRLAAVLTVPATAGIIALRTPIIRILYERGKFLEADTLQTANTLLFYALGLFAYSLVKIIVPTFYAMGDTKTPVKISAMVIGIKIIMNLALIYLFRLLTLPNVSPYLAMPLCTSLAATINLTFLARRLIAKVGSFKDMGIGTLIIKMILISTFMGVACNVLYMEIARFLDPRVVLLNAANILIVVLAGAMMTFILSYFFRVEEIREIFSRKRI